MIFAKVPNEDIAINLDCVNSFTVDKKYNNFVLVAKMSNGDSIEFKDNFPTAEKAMKCLFKFLEEAKHDLR